MEILNSFFINGAIKRRRLKIFILFIFGFLGRVLNLASGFGVDCGWVNLAQGEAESKR
jgi:hypothetical protein